MDPELITWIFFLGGLLLMLLETVLPGGVAFFLGFGGLVIAGLRAVGLLIDPFTALLTWIFMSTGLILALRPIAVRYFGGDISLKMTNEDAEAMGKTVKVIEPVGEERAGRVRFRGVEWDARTLDGALPAGAEARILYRENLTWIVEPVDYTDLVDDIGKLDVPEREPPSTPSGHDPSIQPSQRSSDSA